MQLHRYYNKNIMYIKILIIYQMFYLCIFKQLQNDLFIYLLLLLSLLLLLFFFFLLLLLLLSN